MDLLRDFWKELNCYDLGFIQREIVRENDCDISRNVFGIWMDNGNCLEVFFYHLKQIDKQILYIKMTGKDGQKFVYDFDSAEDQNYFWGEVFDDGIRK